MRILFPTIRDPDQIGGGATHLTMLVSGLKELGHEAEALYLTATMPDLLAKAALVWPAGVLNRLRTGWGMVYSADMRGRLLANATARELDRASEGRGDGGPRPWEVLNAQEVYSIPHLRSVADRRKVPLILTLHGYPVYESVSEGYSTASRMGLHYLMRIEMQALRLADAIVTVDARLYRHVLGLVPERSESVYSLMNFIDTSVFAPLDDPQEEAHLRRRLRAKYQVPAGKIVLLCPRRLVKKNGVVYPSLALAAMDATERHRFLLVHAGEGGEREEIERIVSENGLGEDVRLLGGQDRAAILELYRMADIVLVPSVHSENVEEATSLSALEAMASGRPLIAGAVGGLAEMVVDGETGLLVGVDPQALAAAILRLAAAPDLAARLAATARRYVVENHSHVRTAAAYAEIYGRAASRAGSPAEERTPPGLSGDAGRTAGAEPTTPAAQATTGPEGTWPSISLLGFTLDIVTLEQAARWVIGEAEGAASAAPGGIAATTAGGGRGAGHDGRRRAHTAVSFNPELVMRAEQDAVVAEAVLDADLCYPDGVGAVWAAARQGARVGATVESAAPFERVAGIDLAERVMELAADRGLSVFLLGAVEGVAAEAGRRLAERLPGLQIAGTYRGYFSSSDEDEVVRWVAESGAAILLVAMGAPRQELFLHRNRDRLGVAVALGVGGSFDVWSGAAKRAPAWARRAKVEWLYRLASDPRRARRQGALPRFAARVVTWSPDDYGPPRRGRAKHAAPRPTGTSDGRRNGDRS